MAEAYNTMSMLHAVQIQSLSYASMSTSEKVQRLPAFEVVRRVRQCLEAKV